jgi:tetratricopeptide (TPR) repeat protein
MKWPTPFHKKQTLLFSIISSLAVFTLAPGQAYAGGGDMSLLVRRITEYWKEGDFKTAKTQIIDFLRLYPLSEFHDQLYAMLGDLHYQENNFEAAVEAYEKIEKQDLRKKISLNLLQSYFELKSYHDLIALAAAYIKESSQNDPQLEKIRLLYAEAASALALDLDNREGQIHFAQLAKPHLQLLLNGRYEEEALISLAEVSRLLEEYEQAAEFYSKLLALHPEKKEELLFEIADLQSFDHPTLAIDTFAQVSHMKGPKASEAAHNQLLLLYQNQKYADLLKEKDVISSSLSANEKPLIDFFAGKSYFHLEEYQNAIASLEKFIDDCKEPTAELKNALLNLSLCAKEAKDLDAFTRALEKMRAHYSQDLEFAKALLSYSNLSSEKGEFARAKNSLEEVLAAFPHHPDREKILYDYALLLSKKGDYEKGRENFATYLQAYPEGDKSALAWKNLLNCSIKDLQNASPEQSREKKKRCISDLREIIEKKELLSETELSRYHFILGKQLVEIGNYTDAIKQLTFLIENNPYHENLAEAHLLLAMAELDGFSDWEGFILNAERALSLKGNFEENHLIHLHLYNAYLQMKEIGPKEKESEYEENAAAHLIQSFYSKKAEIKPSNLNWLANYYYDKFQEYKKENPNPSRDLANGTIPYLEQTLDVYEALLAATADGTFSIIDQNPYLEEDVIKYAELLEFKGEFKKKEHLLQVLLNTQKKESEKTWKFQRLALFELGKTLEKLGNKKEAIETYDQLINSSTHVSSFHANAALLHRAGLKLSLVPTSEISDTNLQILSILNTFKDLQIKKKVHSEPIHLEAALNYIDLKLQLITEEERLDRSILLYKNFIDDFTSTADPTSADYQAALSHFPEKEIIINDYIEYAKMRLSFLESKKAEGTNQKEHARDLLRKASELLADLQEKKSSLSPYLEERIEKFVKGSE